jgi:putative transposase
MRNPFRYFNSSPEVIRRRAVDHEGEVLEVFATKRRDRRAALKFLKRAIKRYGRSKAIVTDRLRSYLAAMKAIGFVEPQEC